MQATPPYLPLRDARSLQVPVRGLRYHVLQWGDASLASDALPPLVMMHGWMDVGASFQFVVDELARLEGERRLVVAADWRGFGQTPGGGVDTYWFADYLGDLDALLDAVAPGRTVDLVGHSMGANVCMVYAGVRPRRVRRLVNLEGFGLPDSRAEDAPDRLAQWLDELKAKPALRPYASLADVAARLRKTNPRLPQDKADWLAAHWSRAREDGRWELLGDPAHKVVNPVPYRAAEAVAAWRRIEAPLLWVEGAHTRVTRVWADCYPRAEFEARLAQVPSVERHVLADCGHMLHHDQPGVLAATMRAFLDRG